MKVVKIGRSSSNDVNINDPLVSRSHCQIIQDDYGTFRIIDINSANGTYINGTQRHGEVILNRTDIVRIGNTTLPWQTYFANSAGSPYCGGGQTRVDPAAYGRPVNSNDISININSGNNENNMSPRYKPSNYMVWAILATLFCFLPFGIVSIVYASKVDSRWYAGDYDGAYDAASSARTWFWWSVAIALLYYLTVAAIVLFAD